MIAVSMATFVLVSISPIDPVQANVGQAALINMSEAKRAAAGGVLGCEHAPVGALCQLDHGGVSGRSGHVAALQRAGGRRHRHARARTRLRSWPSAWVVERRARLRAGHRWPGANRGRLVDRIVKGYCFLLASVPTFWLGLVFLIVFSVVARVVPVRVLGAHRRVGGRRDAGRRAAPPGAAGAHALGGGGGEHRAAHAREDHRRAGERLRPLRPVPAACRTWGALRHHGLRNLALPALTLQFASISEIFGRLGAGGAGVLVSRPWTGGRHGRPRRRRGAAWRASPCCRRRSCSAAT